MSETKIARFVDEDACKSIFSDKPTFVLRSFEYYRNLIEERGEECGEERRCDSKEGECDLVGGGTAATYHWLISCWTRLEGDEPTKEQWCQFPDSVVAIISTPEKVSSFLEKAFDINQGRLPCQQRFPFMHVEHEEVEYVDEVQEVNFENIIDKTVFTKREKFDGQKEYRFALPYSATVAHSIDSYIFATYKVDYVDTLLPDPQMSEERNKELQELWWQTKSDYAPFNNRQLSKISEKIM